MISQCRNHVLFYGSRRAASNNQVFTLHQNWVSCWGLGSSNNALIMVVLQGLDVYCITHYLSAQKLKWFYPWASVDASDSVLADIIWPGPRIMLELELECTRVWGDNNGRDIEIASGLSWSGPWRGLSIACMVSYVNIPRTPVRISYFPSGLRADDYKPMTRRKYQNGGNLRTCPNMTLSEGNLLHKQSD